MSDESISPTPCVQIASRALAIFAWTQGLLDSPPRKGAEIGVFGGELSMTLLWLCPRLHLTMVDQWKPYDVYGPASKSGDLLAVTVDNAWPFIRAKALHSTKKFADRRRVIEMDSVAAADHVADDEFDFVFIDADHSYEGCSRDLKAWIPKVRTGGLVCGHDIDADTDFPGWGVRKALEDSGHPKVLLGIDRTWCFVK